MVVLGAIKIPQGFYRGDDRPLEAARLGERLQFRPGLPFLLRGMRKHDGAILRAVVGPLAIQRSGIVIGEEDIEQTVIVHFCGIVSDLNDFGVARRIAADLAVGRILHRAPRIADDDVGNPRDGAEERLHPPEASRSKRCFFHHSDSPVAWKYRAAQTVRHPCGLPPRSSPQGTPLRGAILRLLPIGFMRWPCSMHPSGRYSRRRSILSRSP